MPGFHVTLQFQAFAGCLCITWYSCLNAWLSHCAYRPVYTHTHNGETFWLFRRVKKPNWESMKCNGHMHWDNNTRMRSNQFDIYSTANRLKPTSAHKPATSILPNRKLFNSNRVKNVFKSLLNRFETKINCALHLIFCKYLHIFIDGGAFRVCVCDCVTDWFTHRQQLLNRISFSVSFVVLFLVVVFLSLFVCRSPVVAPYIRVIPFVLSFLSCPFLC